MTKKKKLLFYALSFLVPFAVGILMFICRKIAPFGQYALTAIDGWGQYFPMLREAERDLFSLNTYSFTGALGFDAFAQSGYYTNSPLWLLLFLLPGKITVWEVDMMVLVRFGLMGLTFFIYAFSRSEKAPVSKLILSTAYALSGYTLTFINQFMWMDAVILLPLVALGIERFYREKKWLLYTVSLAVTIWSNFYISYMVCAFAVIWFFKEVLRMGRSQTFKQFLLKGLLFAACSIGAAAVNIPMILSVGKALSETLAVTKPAPTTLKLYHPLLDVLKRMLPGMGRSLEFGPPNIYFGLLTLVFTDVALFRKTVPLRMKIFFAALAAFFLLSFNLNVLDYAWHGFHFPNQLPARQSFLFIFIMLVAAVPGTEIAEGFFKRKRFLQVLLSVLIMAELMVNAGVSIAVAPAVTEAGTAKYDAEIDALQDVIIPKENEFFRTELYKTRDNGGQMYGYYGVSYYSSTMSGKAYQFFTRLGQPIYARNVSNRYDENPYLNALFGIRYLLSDQGQIASPYLEEVRKEGRLVVYENTACLPLGFVADEGVLEPIDEKLKNEKYIEAIFQRLTGDETFRLNQKTLAAEEGAAVEADAAFESAVAALQRHPLVIDRVTHGKITGRVTLDAPSVLVLSLPASDVTVKANGQPVETAELFDYLAGAPLGAGTYEIEIRCR